MFVYINDKESDFNERPLISNTHEKVYLGTYLKDSKNN